MTTSIIRQITDPTMPGSTTFHAMLLVGGRLTISKFVDTLAEAEALVAGPVA